MKYMYADDMCLVAGKEHRLAKAEVIDLTELAGEGFVMMDPTVSSWDVELVNDICADEDFVPRVVYQANTLTNLMLMVECNIGVSILAGHMRQFAGDNVRFVRIRGYENYFKVVCAWRSDANPHVRCLIDVIEACIQDGEPASFAPGTEK